MTSTSEDRISSLPCSLIGEILSYIPTKDAVATSVLSTRWKEMWKLVTCLYFDDHHLMQSPNDWNHVQSQFVKFVYRVLLIGRFTYVKTFTFHSAQSYDPCDVNAWIASVLTCNVQELDLCVPLKRSILLPSNLFSRATLVKLKLGTGILMNVPQTVCLPCVKHVELAWVKFPDDDSLTRFLGGCPLLDSLKMMRCAGEDVRVIKICNPLLTSLDLSFMRYGDYSHSDFFQKGPPTLQFLLDTPFLRRLVIEEHTPEGYVLENLHKLAIADIILHGPVGGKMTWAFQEIHHVAISDLLKGISQVEKLRLFTKSLGRLHIPIFGNLKELALAAHHSARFELLSNFLQRSPQLRCLLTMIDHHDVVNAGVEVGYPLDLELSEYIPNCLLLCLKDIEILDLRELSRDVRLVEYLLRNAQVLEKLIIHCDFRCLEESQRTCGYLSAIPRASSLCQIEFK